ncbi:hypothetical protein QBC36DRAFT_72732 [Triangularia setosa]|uniref:Uncharacterized protein n=1 Tax=Triangularia setosa TaxID=2587417 RepID=A0AAN6WCN9_9PEZI|nr:hypothetical protein QBC36DRAFT_72732 [Podospora setosa]
MVKVLAVLYDGGKHAEEVGYSPFPYFTPLSWSRARGNVKCGVFNPRKCLGIHSGKWGTHAGYPIPCHVCSMPALCIASFEQHKCGVVGVVPGLLGTTENELGIRKWLEDQGHTLVTTSDKDGENSTFDKELVDAEVIITTPYVFSSIYLP